MHRQHSADSVGVGRWRSQSRERLQLEDQPFRSRTQDRQRSAEKLQEPRQPSKQDPTDVEQDQPAALLVDLRKKASSPRQPLRAPAAAAPHAAVCREFAVQTDESKERAVQTEEWRVQDMLDQADIVRCQSPAPARALQEPSEAFAGPAPALPVPSGASVLRSSSPGSLPPQRAAHSSQDLAPPSRTWCADREAAPPLRSLHSCDAAPPAQANAWQSQAVGPSRHPLGAAALAEPAAAPATSQLRAVCSANLYETPDRPSSLRASHEDLLTSARRSLESRLQENTPDFGNVPGGGGSICGKNASLKAEGNGSGPLPWPGGAAQAPVLGRRACSWSRPVASVLYCEEDNSADDDVGNCEPPRFAPHDAPAPATFTSREPVLARKTAKVTAATATDGRRDAADRTEAQVSAPPPAARAQEETVAMHSTVQADARDADQLSEQLRSALSRGMGHLRRLQALAAH
eukprot:gb/GFBE01076325.1/.p1 GENE.gb/GFBE01076325.1/~~gb/GFBE01076325.1/.p1  ORF type:complete len:461 (+),score=71.43 gb/GFBE01076325.1/:1-1383(+)